VPMKRNKGFSLVEISIVLTIIGLLIGSIVGGMVYVQNAKITNAITLAQDLSVAVSTFKQQYHMLPGDMLIDPTNPEIPNIRNECWKGSNKGNNNGLIDISTNNEIVCVPEVLFRAGMARVDQDGGWYVFNSSFGPVTVKAASLSTAVTDSITAGNSFPATHVVEFANLPCDVAQAIDRKMDNDNLASGKAVASGGACAAGTIVLAYAVAL
jgi:prepilin-type N-terminal cleavage/methylation domain-containing protein